MMKRKIFLLLLILIFLLPVSGKENYLKNSIKKFFIDVNEFIKSKPFISIESFGGKTKISATAKYGCGGKSFRVEITTGRQAATVWAHTTSLVGVSQEGVKREIKAITGFDAYFEYKEKEREGVVIVLLIPPHVDPQRAAIVSFVYSGIYEDEILKIINNFPLKELLLEISKVL